LADDQHHNGEEEEDAPPEDPQEEYIYHALPSRAVIFFALIFWAALAAIIWRWGPAVWQLLPFQEGPIPETEIMGRSVNWVRLAFYAVLGLGVVDVVSLLLWRGSTTYALTTEYFFVEKGVLFKRGRAMPLNEIVDVTYRRGFLGSLGGYGEMAMQLKNQKRALVLPAVPRVVKAVKQILACRSRFNRAQKRG